MAYGFYLYSFSQHGKFSSVMVRSYGIFIREYLVRVIHRLMVGLMVLFFWLFCLGSFIKMRVCGALEAFWPQAILFNRSLFIVLGCVLGLLRFRSFIFLFLVLLKGYFFLVD